MRSTHGDACSAISLSVTERTPPPIRRATRDFLRAVTPLLPTSPHGQTWSQAFEEGANILWGCCEDVTLAISKERISRLLRRLFYEKNGIAGRRVFTNVDASIPLKSATRDYNSTPNLNSHIPTKDSDNGGLTFAYGNALREAASDGAASEVLSQSRMEIPLKESLEAHAIRLAKKKGVKGKAILCGVGTAHIPRSDGVPVSVATVSPKDSELLGNLEEAGDAAYQVGSSGARRCHSI
ncbi:hypothetical protein Tco_0370924 [Tanacetum coccineum]